MKPTRFTVLIPLALAALCGGCELEMDRVGREIKTRDAIAQARRNGFMAETKDTESLRAALLEDYRHILATCFPQYNGIQLKVVYRDDLGPSYTLLASHPLFSDYTFSVGPAGRMVNGFVILENANLKKAHVGVIEIQGADVSGVRFLVK